ncbi:MAG: hypothetical protein CMJ18_26815, partial [Phycisphaeraceae bacterium]|nr:hypothetical protein [Phycisphaeraceae bacterium]
RHTIAKTYRLLGELPARTLGCTGITPFPGTELWIDAVRASWVRSLDWSRYGGNDAVMQTDNLSLEDIRFAANMLHEYFLLTRPESKATESDLNAHRDRMRRWVEDGTLTSV